MALTRLQRDVCRLIADHRLASGESYVAGGAALNELLGAPRQSRDVDLFHDSDSALAASWKADRDLLASHGYAVELLRERAGIVEAVVSDHHEQLRMDWTRDSAFRFFPLVRQLDFGGQQPDPGELSRRWHVLLAQARSVIDHLPAEHIGTCVLDASAELCRARAEELPSLLAGEHGGLHFHRGRIRGALPTTRPA